jgi:hypothetical protein
MVTWSVSLLMWVTGLGKPKGHLVEPHACDGMHACLGISGYGIDARMNGIIRILPSACCYLRGHQMQQRSFSTDQ